MNLSVEGPTRSQSHPVSPQPIPLHFIPLDLNLIDTQYTATLERTPDIGLYFKLWKWSYYFCLCICPLILLFSGSYVDSFLKCDGRRGELFDSGTAGAILSVLAYPISNDFGDLPALSPDTEEFEACSTFGEKILFYVIFILLGVSVHCTFESQIQ